MSGPAIYRGIAPLRSNREWKSPAEPGEDARPRRGRGGQPPPVMTHDFPSMAQGKAVPYGTYDVAEDQALVNVGITHDTAEFAVVSIQRWWRMLGSKSYPKAKRLLICADAGGSN